MSFAYIETCEQAYEVGRGFDNENNENDMDFTTFKNDTLRRTFLRGFFEAKGKIGPSIQNPCCSITSNNTSILNYIETYTNIPRLEYQYVKNTNFLSFANSNCIDFLGMIYNDADKLKDKYFYQQYINLLNAGIYGGNLPECFVFKADKNAILPSKTKQSDAGYDLSVIKFAKQLNRKVALYDTGIKLNMSNGFYAEVVPRSSLSKSGYMLANSVGIIDNAYTGNIYVALAKIDDDAEDIKYPFRCCQIIFRRQVHVDMIESNNTFENTSRGAGGFGSTGV
jgi:dUTP pyrophosphatase